MDSDFSSNILRTVLQVDAMYYDAAQKNLVVAQQETSKINSARQVVEHKQAEINRLFEIQEKAGHTTYEVECLAIDIESDETDLAAAYSPFLEAVATVHIMSAASVEAHINERAETLLTGKTWREFERLSLEAKWLFFPRIAGYGELDPGQEPFQGLSRLVTRRNNLVHYKPKQEPWQPPGVPSFLDSLGLTIDAAQDSVTTVRNLISKLASMRGKDEPRWLHFGGDLGFFRVRD
jgi:hypothetical protein